MRRSIVGLAALLPLCFVPFVPAATLPQVKMLVVLAGVLGALAAWLWEAWLRGEARIPKSLLLATVLILPVVYFISAVASGWTSASFIGSGVEQDTVATMLLWYAALALSALALSRRTENAATFLYAILCAGAALIIFEFARFAFPAAPLLSFGGVFPLPTANPLGSWHDLGLFLGLTLFLGLFEWTAGTDTGRVRKGVGAAVAMGSFLALFVVAFRDVWFGIGALLALFAAFSWYNGFRISRVRESYFRILICGITAAILLGIGVFHATLVSLMPERLQFSEVEVRPSWQGTFAVGQRVASGEGALLFGTGPNSFDRDWSLYRPSELNSTLFWDVNFNSGVGTVPTAFVTTGALGLLAWLLVAAALLQLAWSFFSDRHPLQGKHAVLSALLFSALFLVVFQVLYVPGTALSALTFLFLGAVVAARAKDDSAHYTYTLNAETGWGVARIALVAALSIAIVLVSLFTLRSLVSNIFVNKAVLAYQASGSIAEAEQALSKAFAVHPDNDRAHRAAVELGLITLASLAAEGTTDEAGQARLQAQLAATVQHGLAAVAANGADYQNWLTLANLYQELAGAGVEGAYEAAKDAFARARVENPANPVPLFRLAQLENVQGNRAESKVLVDEALALKPDFAAAHFLKSQLLLADGQYVEAQAFAANAAQLTPGDSLVWYNLGTILYASGAFGEAAASLERAVQLQPDYANALFVLALADVRLGETGKALEVLARVKELNPSNSGIDGIIENVRAGRDPFSGVPAL